MWHEKCKVDSQKVRWPGSDRRCENEAEPLGKGAQSALARGAMAHEGGTPERPRKGVSGPVSVITDD